VSLLAVAKRILNVLEVLSRTQQEASFLNNKNLSWEVPLLEATDHMLDALMEHLDDCGGIIRSFFPSSEDKRFKKILAEYKKSVEPYRKHIGCIVNYIKHNQGRLRSVCFSWSGGSSIGYFVEGPISGGGLGPVAEIHPTENTAFSFHRNIPFHICNVFAVGARLAAALHSVNKCIVVADIPVEAEAQKTDWAKALTLASDLPRMYFPDEINKSIPFVQVKEKRTVIEYPSSKAKVHGPPPGSRIGVSYHGDGVTSTFKMPYY
jgi:hypothetical protein